MLRMEGLPSDFGSTRASEPLCINEAMRGDRELMSAERRMISSDLKAVSEEREKRESVREQFLASSARIRRQ